MIAVIIDREGGKFDKFLNEKFQTKRPRKIFYLCRTENGKKKILPSNYLKKKVCYERMKH